MQFSRLWAIFLKELLQLRRDKLSLGMVIFIPIIQLILFGFAINTDPHHLPTGVRLGDDSAIVRSVLSSLKNTGYYDFQKIANSDEESRHWLQSGQVQFVVNIPLNFTRDLVRGDKPTILIEADATDPVAVGNTLSATRTAVLNGLHLNLSGALRVMQQSEPPVKVIFHKLYNPEGQTRYNIVPGLLGIILTNTMVMMTAMGMTRERENGTLENLLAMPMKPIEVMFGKMMPYIGIGCFQVCIILFLGYVIFQVPIVGSLFLVAIGTLLFITANLAVGFTISTISKTQLQAMQMSFFFFLPSMLLSGFMFPFSGMPGWAQFLGSLTPLMHYLQIIRRVVLKGGGIEDIAGQLGALIVIVFVLVRFAISRYKQTLD